MRFFFKQNTQSFEILKSSIFCVLFLPIIIAKTNKNFSIKNFVQYDATLLLFLHTFYDIYLLYLARDITLCHAQVHHVDDSQLMQQKVNFSG